MHACMRACVCAYIHLCMHACMHACMCVRVRVRVRTTSSISNNQSDLQCKVFFLKLPWLHISESSKDRFHVVASDGYFYCPPAIDFIRVAMEGGHTWNGSINIRVHFWLEVVTLNPVNNQTGKRHFICVSMATNQYFLQDVGYRWSLPFSC